MKITKLNDVHLKIECEQSIAQELSEYFSFEVPGARFQPKVRNGMWDGRFRLFSLRTGKIYVGLLSRIQEFARERDIDIELDVSTPTTDPKSKITIQTAKAYYLTLNPEEEREYQWEALHHCISQERSLLVSPTGSGKSFIIYGLINWYTIPTLVIVDRISLVQQMQKEFVQYGMDPSKIHMIYEGQEKEDIESQVVISTYQSIAKFPKSWFDRYEVVIGDECHQYEAKSFVKIMEKLCNCRYRFGFTGTLKDTPTNRFVLEGLFGKLGQFKKTHELIEDNVLANLKIKAIVLNHRKEDRLQMSKTQFQDEIKYLINSQRRNTFIKNLVLKLKGNTLVLFQYVDSHGKVLYDQIKAAAPNRSVNFIHGKVKGDKREEVRTNTEQESDSIIVASYGTFSTGINIRNLHNIVFASPSKSRVRTLQSIGRGLRKGQFKEQCNLYDIADSLSTSQKKNYTLKHFEERVKYYIEERFDYTIYPVDI